MKCPHCKVHTAFESDNGVQKCLVCGRPFIVIPGGMVPAEPTAEPKPGQEHKGIPEDLKQEAFDLLMQGVHWKAIAASLKIDPPTRVKSFYENHHHQICAKREELGIRG